jgi:hypothetical protein
MDSLYFEEENFLKIRKVIFLIIGAVLILLLSCFSAMAATENDNQGDVWHFVWPYWQEQAVDNQPNIDIKEIKAETNGDQITLSMSLWQGGTFSRGDNSYAMYVMFYNTSDAYYMMTYGDIIGETPLGNAIGFSLDGSYLPSSAEVIVEDNTISATMDKVGDDTTTVEFYGTTWMWEEYYGEELTHDQWHDWIGDYTKDLDFGPGSGDDDDDDGDNGGSTTASGDKPPGTAGFEILTLISAIGISLIILRKRK